MAGSGKEREKGLLQNRRWGSCAVGARRGEEKHKHSRHGMFHRIPILKALWV